jgi:hypothetical protein
MIYCLFTLTFHSRVRISPSVPNDIKFVQRGFTKLLTDVYPPSPALDGGVLNS